MIPAPAVQEGRKSEAYRVHRKGRREIGSASMKIAGTCDIDQKVDESNSWVELFCNGGKETRVASCASASQPQAQVIEVKRFLSQR